MPVNHVTFLTDVKKQMVRIFGLNPEIRLSARQQRFRKTRTVTQNHPNPKLRAIKIMTTRNQMSELQLGCHCGSRGVTQKKNASREPYYHKNRGSFFAISDQMAIQAKHRSPRPPKTILILMLLTTGSKESN